MISTLVIKVIRACNLRCQYCYYINEDTPHYGMAMSPECVEALYKSYAAYLNQQPGPINFVWHGGEPLMLGRRRFGEILDLQRAYFEPSQVRNMLQTNGVLISEEWLDFFSTYDIRVGISLDGPRELHDRRRVTATGGGSYDSVVRSIEMLRRRGMGLGLLGVASSEADGTELLHHFRSFGVGAVDFLIPMTNHAIQRTSPEPVDMAGVGRCLRSAFAAWTGLDDASMRVRLAMFVAVSVALGAAAASPGAVAAAAGLDYEFFKTKVQPIFVKKRENHARCIQCHTEANNFVRLERLAPGQAMWNEEQSKKNYEWVSKAVSPANRAQSRLLIHPLAPEAGGDLFHSGGRQFESKNDPDYQVLMQWVGVTANSGGFSK